MTMIVIGCFSYIVTIITYSELVAELWKKFIRQNSTQHVQKTHKNETLQTMY